MADIGLAVGPEEQPEEHRDAGQADGGDDVGDGEDAVQGLDVGRRPVRRGQVRRRVLGSHTRQSTVGRCPASNPSPDSVTTPPSPWTRSSHRPTTSSTPRSGPDWPSVTWPTPSTSSCPCDDPRTGLDRYQSAAAHLARWIGEGILQRDSAPAFYAYRMTAPGGGTTTGVIGALGCDPGGDDVLPHEQTMPKDTSDRLDLLRACRTNLSPIWGLSLSAGVSKTFEPDGPPTAEATDDDGVGHALWVLDDDAVIEAIAAGVGAAPLVIADGHHRYQTALTYQAERRAAGDSGGGYHSIMALVVELSRGPAGGGSHPPDPLRPPGRPRPGRDVRGVVRHRARGPGRSHPGRRRGRLGGPGPGHGRRSSGC